jgi:LysR family transcriptional regulator, regulator for metE and metH
MRYAQRTMALEVRHLELVRAVAAAGGLSRATSVLNLTESALSRQLTALEGALGARLFLRTGRRMLLTPAGERLLESADGVLGALRRTEEEIRRLSADGAGLLRLATECYTCYHWLPSLLREFSARHPRVELRILAEATHRPVPELLDGRIDLAITSAASDDRRLRQVPLFKDELVAVLPPGHRLASRAFLRAEDFAGESLVLYVPPADSTLVQEVMLPAGVQPARVTQVQLTEAIVEMVRAGLGVSLLARWAIAPQLAANTLRAVRVTRRGLRRHWQATTLRATERVPHVDEFIRLLARGAGSAAQRVVA